MEGSYKTLPTGKFITVKPALIRMAQGFGCLGFHMALGTYFSVKFCGTVEYASHGNFLYRVLYYFLAMTGQRFFYYTPWCLSDASCIACGISYNGTEKSKDQKLVH